MESLVLDGEGEEEGSNGVSLPAQIAGKNLKRLILDVDQPSYLFLSIWYVPLDPAIYP